MTFAPDRATGPDPTAAVRYRLRPAVHSVTASDGQHYLTNGRAGSALDRLTGGQQQLLHRLASDRPATLTELRELAGSPATEQLLARLRAGGWLVLAVSAPDQDRPRYTLTPHRRPGGRPTPPAPGAELSRFTVVTRDGADFVVESPRSWCGFRLHDHSLLAALGSATNEAAAGPVVARLRADLWWAGMLVPAGAEESALATRQWSPAELWCHRRSRLGHHQRYGDGVGATWWAKGEFDPPPARPQAWPGPTVDLPRPELSEVRDRDRTLTEAIEDGYLTTNHDDQRPITVAQLGELLYRSARTRLVWQRPDGVELQDRPYRCAGWRHELELYLVVRVVAGLAPGMYHYDSHAHRLAQVCPTGRATQELLKLGDLSPQVLLVIAARWGRLMHKYQGNAYPLALKHAGVLSRQLELVAGTIGLSAEQLSIGDSDWFADATGLDPLIEDSVAELMLGSRPDTGLPPPWTWA